MISRWKCKNYTQVDNTGHLFWIGESGVLVVDEVPIPSPMVYLSISPDACHPGYVCTWLPDTAIPVPLKEKYVIRRDWIKWMRNGRSSPDMNERFVVAHLGGLERRAILERKDIPEVFREVCRLCVTFWDVPHVFQLSCNLLVVLHMLDRTLPAETSLKSIMFRRDSYKQKNRGGTVSGQRLIPSDLLNVLMTIQKTSHDASLSLLIAQHLSSDGDTLFGWPQWMDAEKTFIAHFNEKYPNGFTKYLTSPAPMVTSKYDFIFPGERSEVKIKFPNALENISELMGILELWNQSVRNPTHYSDVPMQRKANLSANPNSKTENRRRANPTDFHPDSANIDWDKVKRLEHETTLAQNLLHENLGEQSDEQSLNITLAMPIEIPHAVSHFDGLDNRLSSLIRSLGDGHIIETAAFREACSKAGFMPGAAKESINEWSDGLYGEFVIEGDGPYTINRTILAL